jgi:hypothetical protein
MSTKRVVGQPILGVQVGTKVPVKHAKKDAERLEQLLNLRTDETDQVQRHIETEVDHNRRLMPPRSSWSELTEDEFKTYQVKTEDLLREFLFTNIKTCQNMLRDYADSWLESGYDIHRWSMRNRAPEMMGSYRASLLTQSPGNRPSVFLTRVFDRALTKGELYVWDLFLQYILGPYYSQLGRCARCFRYFVNTSGQSAKRYCSQRCARSDSAVKAVEEKRRKSREEKLRRVQLALNQFAALPEAKRSRIPDWKKWVARKAGPETKTNVVTRMLKGGELNLAESICREIQRSKRKENG